jgi:tRNA threonylcarbamoyladenosine biosynthesis protein TsaE
MKVFKSYSSSETKKIGTLIASKISKISFKFKKEALILALIGELGTGKTTFISGFLKGLGIKKQSPSPTFILIRRKKIKNKNFKNLYHIDVYRIKNPKELISLGFKKIIQDPKNIVLIEWANKIIKILPKNTIQIYFYHGKSENERKIILKNISL